MTGVAVVYRPKRVGMTDFDGVPGSREEVDSEGHCSDDVEDGNAEGD
jgi:hypothetical protein